ncbi:hypothetical protein CASFOL_042138 [Castilleja foliolosa]|uniref:Uncharacterized protein n=1 Tax=Castilleja foliolosa TaxID=1961234 RepID=A0ABD3B9X5_9LAMI
MAPTTQISLIGPPEIHHQPPPAASTTTTHSDPSTDLLIENFNTTLLPPMGLTENNSLTFLSSGNPCLDFFFHVVPNTPPETLTQRLDLAWKHDPLKTLKLLCNLRGVRGTGKSDKEGAYTAVLWLHENHPKTLACNVPSFAGFGYFKDLLEILFRLLEGPDARKLEKKVHEDWKQMQELKKPREHRKQMKETRRLNGGRFRGRGGYGRGRIIGGVKNTDLFKKFNQPKLSNEEKRMERARKAVERFNSDPDFKFLHNRVSDYFAECLRSDMKMLESGHLKKISLAAKWCPSLDSAYDQITLLCEPIAKKVFPREEYPEYEGVEEAHYAYRVRDRLRKQVLVPLRKSLELPEVYIGVNDWGSIPYNRVASVAMKTYKGIFYKHDEERFKEYLEKVKNGEATIAAGALLPHKIIASLEDEDDDSGQVAELQWKRMVDDMAKKGTLNNCLAISDVSGSMSGIPMEVSVALGVLVSELSDEPWKGKLITFSADPELQTVVGGSLKEKTEFVRKMEWGANTNFQKVFDLLLQVAVNGKLKPEQMIKRLFVFSDMEFDQASANQQYWLRDDDSVDDESDDDESVDDESDDDESRRDSQWETDYQVIVKKFTKKGYGKCVPEIVFWNLRDSEATPVPGKQPGVALVSGYSKNLMKMFLEEGGIVNPEAVMDAAISGEEYEKLVVLD